LNFGLNKNFSIQHSALALSLNWLNESLSQIVKLINFILVFHKNLQWPVTEGQSRIWPVRKFFLLSENFSSN